MPEFNVGDAGISNFHTPDKNVYFFADSSEVSAAELESVLPAYDRPLDDYLELFIQVASEQISSAWMETILLSSATSCSSRRRFRSRLPRRC